MYPMKGGISVEVVSSPKINILLKLWEKKSGPSNHTSMLIKLLSEKSSFIGSTVSENTPWKAKPIFHETSQYNFAAKLNLEQNKIETKLTIK